MSSTLEGLAWGVPERGTCNGTRPPFLTRNSFALAPFPWVSVKRDSLERPSSRLAVEGAYRANEGEEITASPTWGWGGGCQSQIPVASDSLLVGIEHSGCLALRVDAFARHACSCQFYFSASVRISPGPACRWMHTQHAILFVDDTYLSFAFTSTGSKGKILSSRNRAPSGPASVLFCLHCTQEGSVNCIFRRN